MTRQFAYGGMATALVALLAVATINTLYPGLTEQFATQTPPAPQTGKPDVVAGGAPAAADPRLDKDLEARAAAEADESFRGDVSGSVAKAEPATPAPREQKAKPAPGRRLRTAPQSGIVASELSDRLARPPVMQRRSAVRGDRAARPAPVDRVQRHYQAVGRDQFANVAENGVKRVAEAPVSTFSIDVDTASYAFVRRMLNRGVLPQKDAVRVEEMINYFHYDYPQAESRERPFAPTVTVLPSPWKKGNKLIHIGIKGYDIERAEAPRSNLVFLLDVSGSMNAPDKLPLLVNSMKLLLETLKPDDTVAIVVYAGAAGTVLEPTKVADKQKILAALDRLRAGGSTAGAAGIRQAYALAEGNFDDKAVNRVILATDGDFNVGITNREELKGFIERKRKTGIYLSVLGFGQGNLNDRLMQTLAQNGNGVAAHIDTLNEARKVLVEEATSTLFPIAKDVKIQVEFNPRTVAEYRLIGYETRALRREDFNNDKVDAGDIGAGHTVTAIYEITPVTGGDPLIGASRYQRNRPAASSGRAGEYGFLKIRYKRPKENASKLISTPITRGHEVDGDATGAAGLRLREARWATGVAAFGQILKGGRYTGDFSHDDVIALARSAKGEDEFGYRAEFLNLVRLARTASPLPRR